MFQKVVKANISRLTEFGEALKSGDAAKVEKIFTSYLYDSITVRDSSAPSCAKRIGMDGATCRRAERGGVSRVQNDKKEILYHGEMIGILVNIEGWDSKTNADAGDGYSDVMVKIEDSHVL